MSSDLLALSVDPETKRSLYVLEVDEVSQLPTKLVLSSSRCICLVMWDIHGVPDKIVKQVACWLIDQGAVYVCCLGHDSKRLHDAVDWEDIIRQAFDTPVIVTTWHERGLLNDALFFVLKCTEPYGDYAVGCSSTIAISIGNSVWAASAREAFTDSELFNDKHVG